MPDRHDWRASDADRHRAIDELAHQAGQGRLTISELDQRASAAATARTYGDLEPLLADLPHDPAPATTNVDRPGVAPGHLALIAAAMLLLLVIVIAASSLTRVPGCA